MASDIVETGVDQVEQVLEGEAGVLLGLLVMVVLGVAGIFAVSV